MAMIESHFIINVAQRTDKPLDGFGPHWAHDFAIELPRGMTLKVAAMKKKELEILLNPTGGVQRKLTLTRVNCKGTTYSDAELDACHVTGKWPADY